MEDIVEEQPLQDQKKESDVELTLRDAFRKTLDSEIVKLAELIEKLQSQVDLFKVNNSATPNAAMSKGAMYSPDQPDGEMLDTGRVLVRCVIDYVTQKKDEWRLRLQQWSEKKRLVGEALKVQMPAERDELRTVLHQLARESLLEDMRYLAHTESKRRADDIATAHKLAQQHAAELIRGEHRAKEKQRVKETKACVREEKQQKLMEEQNETKQIEAAAKAAALLEDGDVKVEAAVNKFDEQKQMLGERLFPLIQKSHETLAGKITGMLLEMDNSELLHLLEDGNALTLKVEEAVKVLDEHARATGQATA